MTNSQGNTGAGNLPTTTQAQPQAQAQSNTISWQGFRVPSQDTHGHSERMYARVQPGHARQIQTVVASKVWPYRESGDVIRHAIDRHLKWLESMVPIPSVTKQVDAILEIVREQEFMTDFRAVFDKLQTQVSMMVGMGEDQEARHLVNRVKQLIEDMPDGAWRRRYQQTLEERFGHLMTRARGMQLNNFAPDDGGN